MNESAPCLTFYGVYGTVWNLLLPMRVCASHLLLLRTGALGRADAAWCGALSVWCAMMCHDVRL